jgi:hypothetical protein
MITTKCVGAVTLTEIRDALHGAQIPETPSHWANQGCSEHGRSGGRRSRTIPSGPSGVVG